MNIGVLIINEKEPIPSGEVKVILWSGIVICHVINAQQSDIGFFINTSSLFASSSALLYQYGDENKRGNPKSKSEIIQPNNNC